MRRLPCWNAARQSGIGTYQTSFAVLNLNRETVRVPISTVVLTSQRVPLGDAIYSVKQKTDAEAANPLVYAKPLPGDRFTLISRVLQDSVDRCDERANMRSRTRPY